MQIKYHEDFEKMKGHKIQIADDPEMSRHLKNTQVVSQAAYHNVTEQKKHMDQTRPPLEETARRSKRRRSSGDCKGGVCGCIPCSVKGMCATLPAALFQPLRWRPSSSSSSRTTEERPTRRRWRRRARSSTRRNRAAEVCAWCDGAAVDDSS